MIRRPPRSTHCISSAASDVYKRQCRGRKALGIDDEYGAHLDECDQSNKSAHSKNIQCQKHGFEFLMPIFLIETEIVLIKTHENCVREIRKELISRTCVRSFQPPQMSFLSDYLLRMDCGLNPTHRIFRNRFSNNTLQQVSGTTAFLPVPDIRSPPKG